MAKKPLQDAPGLGVDLGGILQSQAMKLGLCGVSPLMRLSPPNLTSMLPSMPKTMMASALSPSPRSPLFGLIGKSLRNPYFISGT
jgi:hypothetical protein